MSGRRIWAVLLRPGNCRGLSGHIVHILKNVIPASGRYYPHRWRLRRCFAMITKPCAGTSLPTEKRKLPALLVDLVCCGCWKDGRPGRLQAVIKMKMISRRFFLNMASPLYDFFCAWHKAMFITFQNSLGARIRPLRVAQPIS